MDDKIIASGGWGIPTPQLWDSGIVSGSNSNTWNRNIVHTPPAKTSAEFAQINTEVMTKEQVLKQLNNALVALEEAEAAWKEEHEARIAAETTVKELREAGFTGFEDDPEEEEEEVEPEEESSYIPAWKAPRGGITYNTPPGQLDTKKVADAIAKYLKSTEWGR